MTTETVAKDRKARRVERTAVENYRRRLRVSYERLAHQASRPSKWVWDCLSDKSVAEKVMYSDVQGLREALDEIAEEGAGAQ